MSANGKSHICPLDRRAFATKAALRQHRRMVHEGQAPVPRATAQVSGRGSGRGRNRNRAVCRGDQGSRTVSGTDMLAVSANVSSVAPVGTVLLEMLLSPLFFVGTRLEAEASLWARWRPVRLSLRIQPSAGSMTSGAYVVGHTFDLNEKFQTNVSAVNRVMAMRPSSTSNIYSPSVFNIPSETSQKWLLTSTHELADSCHGKVVLVLAAPIGNVTSISKISFMLSMNWTVAFEGAVLPGSAGASENVYCDPGYEGYHTTSISDWASGRYLTLKHTAGGAAVPFSMASPEHIYQLDKQAVLKYQKSATSTDLGDIHYATLIKDYPTKIFAVFEDEAKAKSYRDSGNLSYCTSYFGAGSPVSPDNPAWIPVAASVTSTVSSLEMRVAELSELVSRLLVQETSVASSFLDLQSPES